LIRLQCGLTENPRVGGSIPPLDQIAVSSPLFFGGVLSWRPLNAMAGAHASGASSYGNASRERKLAACRATLAARLN
jgi:hypothetical protein